MGWLVIRWYLFSSSCTPCDGKLLENSHVQELCLAAADQCSKGVVRTLHNWPLFLQVFKIKISEIALKSYLGSGGRTGICREVLAMPMGALPYLADLLL